MRILGGSRSGPSLFFVWRLDYAPGQRAADQRSDRLNAESAEQGAQEPPK